MIQSINQNQNKSQSSVSFTIPTPDGKLYVFIVEKTPGVVDWIDATIGKGGHSVNAWMFTTCQLINEMFASGKGIADVLDRISNITSDRSVILQNGSQCQSGPHGLTIALTRYMNANRSISDITDFKRPPKLTNPRRL